jgi:tRNA A37 threonylcarbamoyltransferase TsaD
MTEEKRLFPEVMLERDSLDFSFSGLKTAVKREVDKRQVTDNK